MKRCGDPIERPVPKRSAATTSDTAPAEQGGTGAAEMDDAPALSTWGRRVFGDAGGELEEILRCPVCRQLLDDPHVTQCGHNFCRLCLRRCFADRAACPQCAHASGATDFDQFAFPNAALGELLRAADKAHKADGDNEPVAVLSLAARASPSELDALIDALQRRRDELKRDDGGLRKLLAVHALEHFAEKRNKEIRLAQAELHELERDRRILKEAASSLPYEHGGGPVAAVGDRPTGDFVLESALCATSSSPSAAGAFAERLRRGRAALAAHLDELHGEYAELKARRTPYGGGQSQWSGAGQHASALHEFESTVSSVASVEGGRRLAQFNFNEQFSATRGTSINILSSIEFDKDAEYFVLAGVGKKIKLYNYDDVCHRSQAHMETVQSPAAAECDEHSNSSTGSAPNTDSASGVHHYPVSEMQCAAKISCCNFNYACKQLLASTDYDGTVQLWDVNAAKSVRQYTEHTTRSWTVHFNVGQPRCLASGADDGTIKLWNTNAAQSVCTMHASVNVCCVHFNPVRHNELAAGLSNHAVHVYDIRMPCEPVSVLNGHTKAVAYVRFLSDGGRLVSASTDSSLRLWHVHGGGGEQKGASAGEAACRRVFTGHLNEKNFVGMSVDDDLIVCGSESNSLYVYNRSVSKPLLRYGLSARRLPHAAPVAGANAHQPFISAVAWKKGCKVIVAANSVGNAEIVQLY